ncbi:MAG TPA: pyridoxal 5'-phosphate synthase glutaminase subunit PdxT [Acidimicrobiales bacterium]|nr:pyridoxal 5'-phosphate synthase glutaminase subunit PdxT [Acidimicrobiales bacterium]
MNVGVLALQGDVAEHLRALADLAVAGRPVRRPSDLSGLDGIVLPGGESTTMSMLLSSSELLEPLGKEIAAGLPVFGTCAGMILLGSSVIGGRQDQICYGAIDIAVRRNGYGRQLASFECDLDVPAVGGVPFHAVFIRAPLVEATGDAVEVLATVAPSTGTPDGTGGGLTDVPAATPVLCRQGPVLVAAFHPELTADRRVHRLFVSMIEERGR